jgi:cytosine/adenosine deaminase-related metal-dependent hydrolase
MGWARPVSLVNGRVWSSEGIARSIRFAGRVLGFDDRPRRGDTVVDLDGSVVLPGLINAHDHLELNHYGRLKVREVYANATEWIDDLRPALNADPGIRANRAHALADRLFIGGLKNLLAGATTVAHHNPLYDEIAWHVPVRVVRRFGWAHSFALEREPVGAKGERGGDVRQKCLATASNRPFVVHAGEGVDTAAARELERLGELDCLRINTVVVHGVAMTPSLWRNYVAQQSSVVWCPASNRFLFDRTLAVRALLDECPQGARHLCLGTDSRLTGAMDLLDELLVARTLAPLSSIELLKMVTDVPARILRLDDAGRLAVNGPADLVVVPGSANPDRSAQAIADALVGVRRQDVQLVVVGGQPIVGVPSMASVFASRRVTTRGGEVDGTSHLFGLALARRISRCGIAEPGVSVH